MDSPNTPFALSIHGDTVSASHYKLVALLEAVKDQPGDDDRRIALADWLEERGSEDADRARGRFIRLQCRRAKLLAAALDASGPAPGDVRQGGLRVDLFPAAG